MNKTLAPVLVVASVQTDPLPVQFGGAIDLELGLAESIKFLNERQLIAAALGFDWLYEMQEGELWA
jgi:hypothetical protein